MVPHRWWMERWLALAFAAVTLRGMMAPLMATGGTGAQTHDVAAWGFWLVNVALLEARQRWPAQSKMTPETAAFAADWSGRRDSNPRP